MLIAGNPSFGQPQVTAQVSPQVAPAVENFTAKVCAMNPKLGGVVCTPTIVPGALLYMNLQDAIEKSAIKLNMTHEALKIDGLLGPSSARLAMEVLLNQNTPQTEDIKFLLAQPRMTEKDWLTSILATKPKTMLNLFDGISGFQRPEVLTDPRPVPPSVPPTTTPPIPTSTTDKPMFWTRRNKIIISASSGVLAVGLLALLLWPKKKRRAVPAAEM